MLRLSLTSCLLLFLSFYFTSCSYGNTQIRKEVVNANKPGANTESNNSKININTASAQDLQRLPGVGRVTALRIVEHREKYGHFRRPEHLMLVEGISEERFKRMSPYVKVE